MNRCIQCYRCVRYYKDYAGGTDFGVFGAHNHLYFGRFEDGALESEFSGNLIEVCPTGVFTDKTLKTHYTRKWDLTNAPSICNNCSVGCNTIVGERYGMVRRVLNRYNKEVNGYFLCDRGRFGYDFINADNRIKKSLFNKVEISTEEAVAKAASILSGNSIGIGSPTASIEANYALQKLVGKENFYAGVPSAELKLIQQILEIYKSGNVHVPSLIEIEQAEGVLILGEDILATAPRVALSVRQSIKNKPMSIAGKLNIPEWHRIAVKTAVGVEKGPLFIATPEPTKIDDAATATYRSGKDGIAKLSNGILNSLTDKSMPADLRAEEKEFASIIASTLSQCKSVVVISGTNAGSETIEAAAAIAKALAQGERKTGLYCVVPESNSLALGILADKSLDDALQTLENGKAESLVVLENNIFNRAAKEQVNSALGKCKNIISIDSNQNDLTAKANLVLAGGTFAESEGTLINAEGRMQRYFSVLPALNGVRQSWKWLAEIEAHKAGKTNTTSFDSLVKEISENVACMAKIIEVAPNADYRLQDMKIPRQTPRFSGRTSMQANINVSEPKPPQDENSALAFSMEGSKSIPPAELTSFYWSPGWNSMQASNKYLKDLNNALKGRDPGIRIFE